MVRVLDVQAAAARVKAEDAAGAFIQGPVGDDARIQAGQRVTKGEVLMLLESSDLMARLQQSRAAVDAAQAALAQAHEARMHILEQMNIAIASPREEMSAYAPRYITMKINPDRIRDVIGKGGATIRTLTEETGASIDIDDSGTVKIASVDQAAGDHRLSYFFGVYIVGTSCQLLFDLSHFFGSNWSLDF